MVYSIDLLHFEKVLNTIGNNTKAPIIIVIYCLSIIILWSYRKWKPFKHNEKGFFKYLFSIHIFLCLGHNIIHTLNYIGPRASKDPFI